MEQLALDLVAVTAPATMIERVSLPAQGKRLRPGELSSFRFQRWLGECKQLLREGWDVTVLLERGRRTAVLLAIRDARDGT